MRVRLTMKYNVCDPDVCSVHCPETKLLEYKLKEQPVEEERDTTEENVRQREIDIDIGKWWSMMLRKRPESAI